MVKAMSRSQRFGKVSAEEIRLMKMWHSEDCDLALGGLQNSDHPFISILTLWLYAMLAHPSLDLHVCLLWW